MRYSAIEYKTNGADVKGFIQIPEDFIPSWYLGFQNYLREKDMVRSPIYVYPLNVKTDSDYNGKALAGYTDLSSKFSEVVNSLEYYPKCSLSDSMRRSWAKLNPKNSSLKEKITKKGK